MFVIIIIIMALVSIQVIMLLVFLTESVNVYIYIVVGPKNTFYLFVCESERVFTTEVIKFAGNTFSLSIFIEIITAYSIYT